MSLDSDRVSSRFARSTTETERTDHHGEVTVDRLELSDELSGADGQAATADVAEYALRLGDDALILSQQLGAWIARAPELEEDVALANIALDLLGQARHLLSYAAESNGGGRSEDDLAFLRDPQDFLNLSLVEQPNGDFGQTIVRQFLIDAWQLELFERLQQ